MPGQRGSSGSLVDLERGFHLGPARVDPATNEIAGVRVDAKAMDVLLAITRAAPDVVSVRALLVQVWPDVVVVDNVVHQAVAQLRRALGDDARRPKFIESIPRRGYRLLVAPEHNTLYSRQLKSALEAPAERLLAVLIFDALSNDPELMHFADGVAEEIRSTVRRRTQLNVVGRASSLQFRGSGKSATHVGAVLGASHVLDGTVRRHEGTVRISAELVECSTANTVWSERFDRLLGDAFNIQDEVATAVVRALALQVSADARGTTTSNTDAYAAYVQGRILTTYSNAERSRAAIEHLKRAVDLDPEFASAHGELAVACALHSGFVPLEEIRVQWAAAFARALEINPRDSNALAAKAYYVTLTEWDWRTAGELYTKARDVGLSSNAVLLYGAHYLAPLGRWLEARDLYKATLLTDPYNLSILFDLGQWSPRLDPQDSLLCADRILEMYPGNHDAWVLRADAYAAMGLQSDARIALDQIEVSRLEKFHRYLYVNALVTLGERRRVDELISEFEREAAVSPRRSWLTWTYAVAGEHEKAISSYEAEFAASEFGVLYLRSSFASLPHTPRYEALLKKMHLDDDWLRDAGLL